MNLASTRIPDDKKREIRQLWDMAELLFEMAEREFANVPPRNRNRTSKKLTEAYQNGIPDKQNVSRRLSIVNTFLSSAAIRLTTISEICKKNGVQILQDDYLGQHRQHRREDDKSKIKSDLENNVGNYIHVLLRDNIRHEERAEGKVIYGVRQDIIEKLKVSQIYNLMQEVRQRFKKGLVKCGVLKCALK